jgi:hypothetical protein
VIVSYNTESTDIDKKREFPSKNSKGYQILTTYIDPTMYALIYVVGLLGNGLLLSIFVRHRELRTAANLMIIHLAICDIINLSINAPLHFFFNYDKRTDAPLMTCRIILALRQFLRCAAALAVITLIIQRFIITAAAFTKSPSKRHTTFIFNIVSIIIVWVLPLPITLPAMYLPKFYEPICNDTERDSLPYVIVLNLVLYCFIFPSLMFAFSTQVAKRLNKSAKNIPGEICQQMVQESRIRSARMMMALAFVFVITYFPFQVWVLLTRFVRVDIKTPFMICALHFTKQMLFANGCFNPIAMFFVSSTFRKLLAPHIKHSVEKKVYITKL